MPKEASLLRTPTVLQNTVKVTHSIHLHAVASAILNAMKLGNTPIQILAVAKKKLTILVLSKELAAHGALVDRPIPTGLQLTGLTMVQQKNYQEMSAHL
jgi:hypothetical protein